MVNKTLVVFTLVMCFGLVSAGCGGWFEPSCQEEEAVDNLATDQKIEMGTSFFAEEKYTEENQQRLIAASTMPRPTSSLERANLIRRYDFLNDQDKQFYIYLVSYGKVMAFYTAQGKVSSVNSRLTQEQQVLDARDLGVYMYNGNSGAVVVDSPQLDGSYGSNGDGIFFFTTEGAYVEWNGEYMVSDFPLKLSTPPELVKNLD